MAEKTVHRRLPIRRHLAFRFGLILSLGVAAILVVSGLWNVSTQRHHMLELTQVAASRTSALIRSATREAMLAAEPERVERVISSIASSPGIRRVRIMDRDGAIRRSSDPSDRGKSLPIGAFQCQICHVTDPPSASLAARLRIRTLEAEDGTRILNVVEPVPNEPACIASCHEHPDDSRVLGIIDIELPLGAMEAALVESEQQLGIALIATLAGIVLLTGLLSWRMVVRPVRELARAAERVSRGDLHATVPVVSEDEIGLLASEWNTMVGELRAAREELEGWSRTLEDRVDAKTAELEAAHERMLVVEKMASLGKLAAVMAHEINNPLTGIATYARLMQRKIEKAKAEGRKPVAEDAEKVMALVESEASRCGRIVTNLLLFSRTPGARFAEEDLRPIIERCAMLVHHQAELQEVDLQQEIDPELPKIVCDASQIQQVILALVMNAIEAMPGGGTLTVRARRTLEAGRVLLEVEDTGCGIAPADLARVFEPFHSTKEQGEGVGLGLSVVYGIVQRHHGRVDVASKVGQGTVFTVRLPLTQPEDPAEEEGA